MRKTAWAAQLCCYFLIVEVWFSLPSLVITGQTWWNTCYGCIAGLGKLDFSSGAICLGNTRPGIMEQHMDLQFFIHISMCRRSSSVSAFHYLWAKRAGHGLWFINELCVIQLSFRVKTKPSYSSAWLNLSSMCPRSLCCGSGHCCACSGGWLSGTAGSRVSTFSAEPTTAPILADATEHYYNAINMLATSAYVLYTVSSTFKAILKWNAYIEGKVYCGNGVTAHWLYRASITGEKAPEPAVTRKSTPGLIFLIPDKNNLTSAQWLEIYELVSNFGSFEKSSLFSSSIYPE